MINDVKLTLEATAAASMARWLDGRRLDGWLDGWMDGWLLAVGCPAGPGCLAGKRRPMSMTLSQSQSLIFNGTLPKPAQFHPSIAAALLIGPVPVVVDLCVNNVKQNVNRRVATRQTHRSIAPAPVVVAVAVPAPTSPSATARSLGARTQAQPKAQTQTQTQTQIESSIWMVVGSLALSLT
ncbi:hypothetical protein AWZ03_013839 [Drosophila navojoa]|uniref:Uncharacterized protein n=1 Tax=Drosophila navojoa TaxID=7232 RepID=A0A484AT07_DRONA|nr:hypothetical protein AWZ03_013839 [Drosophila navojoa]